MSVADHYHVACGFMKLPPSEFWLMTPMELETLCDSYLRSNPQYVEPVTREQFEELTAALPMRVDKFGKALPPKRAS